MKSNPKVSIIVPIYNARDYLRKCLDSILRQTYSNIEILCIDDGSTDESREIISEYSEKDSRLLSIYKDNGGESCARNTGLKMMTGEYVGFVDCDDWIEPTMLETLLSFAQMYNVDLVASTWYRDQDNSSEKIENLSPVDKSVFGREELLNYIYRRDEYRGFAYMWNKLYKRKLFYDKAGYLMLFDEDLELGGDVLYLAKLVLNTQRAFYVDDAFYHYNQRETSGCHTQVLKKREDWLEAYKRVLSYIADNGIETEALPWIKRFLAYHSSNVAVMAYNQNDKSVLLRCQKIMREYREEYCVTNQKYSDRIKRYEKILDLEIRENKS